MLKQVLLYSFCVVLFTISAQAKEVLRQTVEAPKRFHSGNELFYRIQYNLHCELKKGPRDLRSLLGTILIPGHPDRVVRFDLFEGNHQVMVSLGAAEVFQGVEIVVDTGTSSSCTGFDSVDSRVISKDLTGADLDQNIYLMALKHSPYLVVRSDQYDNRATDIPLELVYSVLEDSKKQTLTLRYTYFFSDEDSKKKASEVDHQMARYGRMTDVEWVYDVIFDKNTHEILHTQYQGGVMEKLRNLQWSGDHSCLPMKGQFCEMGSHPILYNVKNNNVFSDKPHGKLQQYDYLAYQPGLLPDSRVHAPHARERFQVSDQGLYMYRASERECDFEHKLNTSVSDYLYFTVGGKLLPSDTALNWNNGAFEIQLRLLNSDGVVSYQAKSSNSIDRLGEDLFEEETVAAVPVPSQLLQDLTEGKLSLSYQFKEARRMGKTRTSQVEVRELFYLVWDEALARYKKVNLQ